ncbi:N-lysine methyltransferase KMT5A-like [Asterias amurensis]|uniref:N-lysine methyltransferase KMT5A-like n=1 Tax=Asterias amurensis TaxID=7602 RepID=UPI003AB41624
MGKRGRKPKKVALVPESNSTVSSIMTVPGNSPSVKSPKFKREDSYYAQNDEKDVMQPPADKSGKITSYFPKSPEGRLNQKDLLPARGDPNNEDTVQGTMGEESDVASLPLLGLITPDTTPTKECIQPPARSTQRRPLPSSPHHQPTPSNPNPEERDLRPKAAQKLDYSDQVGKVEDDKAVGSEPTNTTSRSADTKEGGKTSRKGKRRSKAARQAKQVQSPSVTLKDYFPVRRSNRKCKTAIEAEEKKMLHHAILSGLEEGVEVHDIVGKGRGVIATKVFMKGDFVVEYHGDHIDTKTARKRESEYAADPSIGCYMYYYQYNNKAYCVDATHESGRIGRLLNHSKSGNCTTKLISINSTPYLILVAAKTISVGEELVYDYGDRDKESLQSHPWLAL